LKRIYPPFDEGSPGHGTSERYWHNTNGSVRSSEELLGVLGEVINHAKYTFGNDRSVILSGWSLGGLLTTVYLQRNPGHAASAGLFAPGVSLAIMRGNPLMVLNLKPERISELLGVNTYKLVHDRDEAKYLRDDPTFFAFPPVSLATALVKLWWEGSPKKYRTPSVVFTAGEDVFAYSPGVKAFYLKAGRANNCQMILHGFTRSYHDIANDINSSEAIGQTVSYLLGRFPR